MADQVPPEGEAPEAQPPQQGDQPAEQGQAAGPSRPPPSSGTPPMTATRMRLGTGRGPTPSRPGGQTPAAGQSTPPVPSTPPAEPPSEQPAEPTPTPAARPAAQPAAQSQRDGAEEQLATEMGAGAVEPTAEADEVPTEPAPPARPATPPAAPRPTPPARPAAAAGAGPAAPPPRAASAAGAPARPAPAAAGPAPAAAGAGAPARPAGSAATAERLAAAVRKEPEPAAGGGAQAEKLVYVWPHLVTIEFLSALLMLLSMIILSWVINAPLEARANPDHTPNPSKAPWYFLNLQELLLHMHPALAGVLVPAGALTMIALIPYFDRDTRDVGKWFGTAHAIPIAVFTTVYTVIVEVAEIFFDAIIGVKPLMNRVADATGVDYFRQLEPFGAAVFSPINTIVPTILMLGPIAPLMLLLWWRFRPNTREVMVALFTGFVVSYVILTIFGTFFRGQGMQLYWPWDPHMQRID